LSPSHNEFIAAFICCTNLNCMLILWEISFTKTL